MSGSVSSVVSMTTQSNKRWVRKTLEMPLRVTKRYRAARGDLAAPNRTLNFASRGSLDGRRGELSSALPISIRIDVI